MADSILNTIVIPNVEVSNKEILDNVEHHLNDAFDNVVKISEGQYKFCVKTRFINASITDTMTIAIKRTGADAELLFKSSHRVNGWGVVMIIVSVLIFIFGDTMFGAACVAIDLYIFHIQKKNIKDSLDQILELLKFNLKK